MRVGAHFNVVCAPVTTNSGDVTSWVDEMRYLDVYSVAGCVLECYVSWAKASFSGALNGILSNMFSQLLQKS
jgi:hypothetical protein